MADETEVITLVYAGRRLSRDKIVHLWYPWKDTDGGVPQTDDAYAWSKALIPAAIGAVYRFDGSFDGEGRLSVVGSSGKLVRGVEFRADELLRGQWFAADQEADRVRSNKSMLTKAAKVEPLDEVMRKLRAVAVDLNRNERRALAVRILQDLGL